MNGKTFRFSNLMHKSQLFFILLVFALLSNATAAQQVKADADPDSVVITINKMIIPTLDVCTEAALANSPLLKATDQQVEALLQDIKIKKSSWLDYVQIDANSRYGLFNQLTVNQNTSGGLPDVAVQSNKEQFNYFAGITIKMPLSYFTNNTREQKKIRFSIKEAELKKEELKNEILKLVVTEYFKLKNVYELLEFQQDNLQTTQLDYLKARADLQAGLLSTTEFASISTTYTKAVEAFSKTKNEYYTQFYILNILTGSNLQKLQK